MVIVLAFSVMSADKALFGNAIIADEDTFRLEEKVYCNASIEDEFAEDRVLVVMTNKDSMETSYYSRDDFLEVECTDYCAKCGYVRS